MVAKNCAAFGVRMVWWQMSQEGFAIARCTVGRPMGAMGLAGAIRRKPVRTIIRDKVAPCPLDRVNWQFHAPTPNRLWPADITYIATGKGWRYFAAVLNLAAHKIVGWAMRGHMRLDRRAKGARSSGVIGVQKAILISIV